MKTITFILVSLLGFASYAQDNFAFYQAQHNNSSYQNQMVTIYDIADASLLKSTIDFSNKEQSYKNFIAKNYNETSIQFYVNTLDQNVGIDIKGNQLNHYITKIMDANGAVLSQLPATDNLNAKLCTKNWDKGTYLIQIVDTNYEVLATAMVEK
ncbi:MAG: hypothetical protein H6553_05615 [Chitinophagales bacterium]|nr:hypothetical protein [Chitinophagales bacterium]